MTTNLKHEWHLLAIITVFSLMNACGKNMDEESKALKIDQKSVILLDKIKKLSEVDSNSYIPFPFGIAAFKGRIYVSSLVDNRIYVLDKRLALIDTIGIVGQGPGELYSPSFIALDENYLYIVEWGNNRVSLFTHDGRFIKTMKSELNFRGVKIAVDSKNHLYVTNPAAKSLISVIDDPGRVIAEFGKKIEQPNVPTRKLNIAFLELDSVGNIYAIFPTHHTVRKYDANYALLWEKDYSTYPPMAWHLESMRQKDKDYSLSAGKKSDKGNVSSKGTYRYYALDSGFYNGMLYVLYAGLPPHGNGLYEINPLKGNIEKVLLFSHKDYQESLYDVTNFCFLSDNEIAACDRRGGNVILFRK